MLRAIMSQYGRWQYTTLQAALQTRRVLLLAGARQCGKTTLSKNLITEDTIYRTLDDVAFLEAAQIDPHGFVKHEKGLMIIDEVQRVPTLLAAIKKQVDENDRPGQYLITGSANIQMLPGVKESLAGRIRKIRLRPLTRGEILRRQPAFFDLAFSQSFQHNYDICDRDQVIDFAFRGGFPEAIKLNDRYRRSWHKDYSGAILERDLKDIINIRRHGAMYNLLQVLAAWSGKFMDISSIGSGLSIKRPTLESYLNALEALYLVEKVNPWLKTDYERIGRQTKIFMTDSGLMASTLAWRADDVRLDSDKVGKLIETFVFNELAVQINTGDDAYSLYQYRDREKREIDFIIEREDGALLGIEVKAGSAPNKDMFKHLQWFKKNLAKDKPFVGIVLYTGESAVSFGHNMWAVPVSALWS